MKYCLGFMAMWSLGLFGLALTVTGIFPFYPAECYPFTQPFLIVSLLSSVLSAAGFVIQNRQRIVFIISLCLFASLVVPWWYAMRQWPGGDDGPGMFWMLFVGGGSILALISVFFMTLYYVAKHINRD